MTLLCQEASVCGRTLARICRTLPEDGEGLYAAFAERLDSGMDAHAAWASAIAYSRSRGERAAWLDSDDISLVSRIVAMVSDGSREQTRTHGERLLLSLEKRWMEAEQACTTKAGLYTTLGALIGAMTAILLW